MKLLSVVLLLLGLSTVVFAETLEETLAADRDRYTASIGGIPAASCPQYQTFRTEKPQQSYALTAIMAQGFMSGVNTALWALYTDFKTQGKITVNDDTRYVDVQSPEFQSDIVEYLDTECISKPNYTVYMLLGSWATKNAKLIQK